MAPEERIEAVVASLVDRRAATASTPIGLSAEEIEAVEHDQPAPIGGAYRRFLELAGGGIGLFLEGSDVFHPPVLGLREAAEDLLAENNVPAALASTDRVILMHQGYWFDYLKGTGPDPEVWTYTETFQHPLTPFRSAGRFSDWLRDQADRHRGPGSEPPAG
ncbi:SMI1/KNR4 family protein [Streptomyces sp. NPDC020917]|uniref:SMI1/KNR4 family protein n=1 Tax=Streptomyces sp. NPDC020917 TaxID=3365102 RepID=UPI00378F8BB6